MRWSLILSLLTVTPWMTYAQQRDRGGFSILTEPGAAVEDGGEVTLIETRFTSGLPPIRSGGRMINIGFEWTHYTFNTKDTQPADFDVESIGIPVRWGFGRKEDWAWSLIFNPSLRTDFDGLTTDDIGLAGLALGRYPWRTNVSVTVGAVYARSFGHDRLFPALGATWNPSPDWQVDVVFPRPRVSYQATASTKLYLGMEPGGDQWNVRLNGQSRDLALEEYRAGAGVDYALVGRWVLSLQGGQVFSRGIKVYDGRDQESKRDLDDTWFARIGLLYR